MSLFEELRRRNVFRVGVAYVVTAWLVAQVSELALDAFEARVLKVLLMGLAIGFPIALVFAWAYELTPEGIKREAEVDRSQSITRTTGRKLDRVIIGVLLVVIAFMGVERYFLADRGTPPGAVDEGVASAQADAVDKSVAVLPFADLSQSQDQEWFADGLAEEILNALARTPDLLVSSRTSSFKYKGTTLDVVQIAKELGVAHVLEGSVRRSGDRIRVTAQLIRASDGFHVWSENYDRDATDVIEIQEDLARSIATALETTMDPEALAGMSDAGTRSVEAYLEYIEGRSVRLQEGRESPRRAYEHFERARAIDPGFARAHVEAADFWALQLNAANLFNNLTDLSPAEMAERFRERIDAAIAAAPTETDRQGYEARKADQELRIRDAIRLYTAYLAERPGDDEARLTLLQYLFIAGEGGAARDVLEQVWDRAQHTEVAALHYSANAYHVIPPVEAADRVMQLVERWPDQRFVAYQAHRTLLWAGRTTEAAALLPRVPTDLRDARFIPPARQACAEGDRGPAEQGLASLAASGDETRSTRWHLLMLLGREDEAAETLRPLAAGSLPGGIADFLTYGQFDPRPYPSLMAVLEREGIERPPPLKIPFACPPPAASDKSVAVLPFLSLSSGADDEYFADGLTEEILNSLSQLPDLLVTARTSAFHFKGQDIPVPAIAKQLNVAHVVEGSVRRAGDRARITAQLIRASDGFHLWSETYDRTMDDVFAVQTDIAEKIATALDVVLDEDMRKAMRNAGARDVEAFISFQKGRELYQLAHGERDQIPTLMEANGFIEQAIARVPDFATAYVIHSDLYTHILIDAAEGHRHEVVTDAMLAGAPERVRADYDAAVEYAESSSRRAYAELDRAFVLGDWRGIAALSDRALSAPGCDSPLWSQLTTSAFGKAREMAAATKRRIDCDPLSAADRVHIVRSLIWDGDFEGAIRLAGEAAGTVRAEWLIGAYVVALAAQGRLDEAGEVARTRLRSDTERLEAAALFASLAGDAEAARAVEEELRQIDPRDGGARLRRAAWRGDHEEANRVAARIDAHPFGHLPLMVAIYQCNCGAPFDLESAPNFA